MATDPQAAAKSAIADAIHPQNRAKPAPNKAKPALNRAKDPHISAILAQTGAKQTLDVEKHAQMKAKHAQKIVTKQSKGVIQISIDSRDAPKSLYRLPNTTPAKRLEPSRAPSSQPPQQRF